MELRAPKACRIGVGSDHAGYTYKQRILQLLPTLDAAARDFGAHSEEPSDYVDYAIAVAAAIRAGEVEYGILVCGSGVGMAIAADKVKGIRAALCADTYTARVCREHNDANVLVLGERVIGIELALDIVRVWISTAFSGEERHVRRLMKIQAEEERGGE